MTPSGSLHGTMCCFNVSVRHGGRGGPWRHVLAQDVQPGDMVEAVDGVGIGTYSVATVSVNDVDGDADRWVTFTVGDTRPVCVSSAVPVCGLPQCVAGKPEPFVSAAMLSQLPGVTCNDITRTDAQCRITCARPDSGPAAEAVGAVVICNGSAAVHLPFTTAVLGKTFRSRSCSV
jgi:hypothetical protein